MKEFNNIQECKEFYDEDKNTYVFKENGIYLDVRFNFDFSEESNIDANNISAHNLKAHDISALNISALNIDTYHIDTYHISALNISAYDIYALDISAHDISALNIYVRTLKYKIINKRCKITYKGLK